MMNMRIRYLILAALIAGKAVMANEVANRPEVDSSKLPKLGTSWLATNPYRGNPDAIAVGQLTYGQTCVARTWPARTLQAPIWRAPICAMPTWLGRYLMAPI